MIYDPSWSKVSGGDTLGRTNIAPRNPWAVLTPEPTGSMDINFVLDIRSQYPTFKVRSDMPVKITSTPMRNP